MTQDCRFFSTFYKQLLVIMANEWCDCSTCRGIRQRMGMEKLLYGDVDMVVPESDGTISLDSDVGKVKKEKMHRCNMCDAKFVRKQHLKQHELVHSKEKKHRCEICEKAFARVGNKRRHEALCRRTTTRGLNPDGDIEQTSSGDIGVPVPVSGDAVNLESGVMQQSTSTRKLEKTYHAVETPYVADELTTSYKELERLLMDHARVYWENVEKGRMIDHILRKGSIPVEALPREFIDARALWLSGQ